MYQATWFIYSEESSLALMNPQKYSELRSCADVKCCHCCWCVRRASCVWFQVVGSTSCWGQIHQVLGSSQSPLPCSLIYEQCLVWLFVLSLPGPRAAESSPRQPGSEGLCESLSQLHLRVHFQQLSWAVQSRVPNRSCEWLISMQKSKFLIFLR